MLRAVGVHGAGRRQHRRAAVAPRSRLDPRHAARRRGQQLPAGDDRHVPSVDRGAAELLARPPGSASDGRGVRARPSSASSRGRRRRHRGDQRRGSAGACDGARRASPGACRTAWRSKATASRSKTARSSSGVESRRDADRAGVGGARAGTSHPERRRGGHGDRAIGGRRRRRHCRCGRGVRRACRTRWNWWRRSTACGS